jgi:hypothetical protein
VQEGKSISNVTIEPGEKTAGSVLAIVESAYTVKNSIRFPICQFDNSTSIGTKVSYLSWEGTLSLLEPAKRRRCRSKSMTAAKQAPKRP